MKSICTENKCTGCRACINICSQDAIQMKKTPLGVEVARIDFNKCVKCELCRAVCPQNSNIELNFPQKCYAAWSLDSDTRTQSASGGIAAELYRWASNHNMWFVGAYCTEKCAVQYEITKDITRIKAFQNSKYVSSNTQMIYKEIAQKLKNGEKVLFIGLPCQVAGLKKYCDIKKISPERLFLADLVCHGTAPTEYLRQHIHSIECKKNKIANEFCFRDPDAYTYTYTFTLKNKGIPFYSQKVRSGDSYQIGYHKGIIYRENCYGCHYAQIKRTGDVTLADFSYVGTRAECSYDNKNVSAVLVNSSKGEKVIHELKNSRNIFCEERPMEEEMDYEVMLHRPTLKPKEREMFVRAYCEIPDFERAMKKSSWMRMVKNEVVQLSHLQEMKHFLSKQVIKPIKTVLSNK